MSILIDVVVLDLLWLAAALTLRAVAPTPLTRKLLTALALYIGVETAFHVPMEAAAAYLMEKTDTQVGLLRAWDFPVFDPTLPTYDV